MSPRQRSAFFAVIAALSVWLLTAGGFAVAKHYQMTAAKLQAFLERQELNNLTGAARAKALRDLADAINSLSPDERQQARMNHLWSQWFSEMTEEEKGEFLQATLPSGFHQMISSFETLAPAKRQLAVDRAVKQLRDLRDAPDDEFQKKKERAQSDTNNPVLSEDLQKKVAMIGLQSVYGNSSAETKAELAPLMEEIQKNMESGRLLPRGN